MILAWFGETNAAGILAGELEAGLYRIAASHEAHLARWHPDAANPFGAQDVQLAADSRPVLRLVLPAAPAGGVSGGIQHRGGGPLFGAVAIAYSQDPASGTWTAGQAGGVDPEGRYRLGLADGTYAVGMATTWWDRPSLWWKDRADIAEADPVTVAAELLGTLVRLGGLGRPGAAPLSAFGSPADGASAGAADQDKTPPRQGSSSPRAMAPSSAARRDRDA